MSETLREKVIDSFTDVIEKMAFMFIEEAEEDEMEASGALKAEMQFTGEHSGSLMIAFSHETVNDLASNVIGTDPDVENINEMRADALRELLNVTCGNLLTTLYGEEPVFDLFVPEVKTVNASEWQILVREPGAISLLVDENPAVIQFKTK